MAEYRLTEKADLGLLYDAARIRYGDEQWKKQSYGAVTREEFIRYCIEKELPTLGFSCDGKPIGGLIFDGTAAHLEVLPEHHGRWGFLWEKALEWIFSNKDPIEVQIYAWDERMLRFMDRNNFQRIRADKDFVTYRMSSQDVPHYRRRRKPE